MIKIKTRVVYLGGKKIGLECLKILYKNIYKLNIDLVGVDISPREGGMLDFVKKNRIKNLSGVIPSCDVIISVQYHRILSSKEIAKATQRSVNLHMAPLPEYRGCNQFSLAILNQDVEFGVTFHEMTVGIDSGPIIAEERFPINDNIWVDELVSLTEQKSIKLFYNSLSLLICGGYRARDQDKLMHGKKSIFNLRKDVEKIKEIDLSWPVEKIMRHIRAVSMPGFSPPYAMIGEERILLIRSKKI